MHIKLERTLGEVLQVAGSLHTGVGMVPGGAGTGESTEDEGQQMT